MPKASLTKVQVNVARAMDKLQQTGRNLGKFSTFVIGVCMLCIFFLA